MRHLDDRISDLVDDRLDHDERDRALAHLAGCAHCREAVDTERYTKRALMSLPGVDVPSALTDKLLGLAEPAGPLPAEDLEPDESAEVVPWPREPAQHAGRARFVDRHRRGARFAAGSMISTGAVLVMLASLGAPANTTDEPEPAAVVPPMERFTAEHARSTGWLPFAEPASMLAPTLGATDDDSAATSGGPGMAGAGSGAGLAGGSVGFAGDGR